MLNNVKASRVEFRVCKPKLAQKAVKTQTGSKKTLKNFATIVGDLSLVEIPAGVRKGPDV